ncbi:MAG: cbb3-type cytochrome oxidase assembly protein CcoS [Proteobacteria bacterium]|nr:cbb3-type cytochrome oxidase assembly protein CcoS [Pseudomonadota bacterium]
MNSLYYLIPITLLLGAIGLGAFLWSLRSGQYEDIAGEAHRSLRDDGPLSTEEAQRRRLAEKKSRSG